MNLRAWAWSTTSSPDDRPEHIEAVGVQEARGREAIRLGRSGHDTDEHLFQCAGYAGGGERRHHSHRACAGQMRSRGARAHGSFDDNCREPSTVAAWWLFDYPRRHRARVPLCAGHAAALANYPG